MTTTTRPGPIHPTVAWILGVAILLAVLAGGGYVVADTAGALDPIVEFVNRHTS